MEIFTPFARPMYVMLKPVGSQCNLRCHYCYYLEKQKLYPDNKSLIISDAMLEKFIKEYIEAQTSPNVLFTWHGGETLMQPIAFYQKALELQRIYARGRHIDNCIQTNGTLITPEWCQFFRANGFLVGVSIDGPQEFHDKYRRTTANQPTFHKVMKGIDLLNKYGVEWNALAVVNDFNVDHPLEFYHFFKEIGCHYIQFSPVVERNIQRSDGLHLAPGMQEGGELTDFSITPQQWGHFLCAIFDEWVRHDVGEYYIQLFDATLANWVGEAPGVCVLARACGHAGVMEHNGDVYSCDHFVYPEYLLGNLHDKTITEMMYSAKQNEFAQMKSRMLPQQCKECRFLFACNGECPKNRFVRDRYGNPGLNYLCPGYRQFFEHVAPYMDFMANELLNNRAPANIMNNECTLFLRSSLL
ncbi:MAG: anaerobic sulfatase-maturation protein [Prevotella sp.]